MPEKLDRCVKKVEKQGKKEDAAYAICSKSTGIKRKKGGGWKHTKESNEMANEEVVDMREFIHKMCSKDYSNAQDTLRKVIDAKISKRIKNLTSDNEAA